MTREEKLQAIEDMGIDWMKYCPFNYGVKGLANCPSFSMSDHEKVNEYCAPCWIESLEDKS